MRAGPLSIIAALFIAAGCSAGRVNLPDAAQARYVAAGCPTTGTLMFVSDPGSNVVVIFSGNTQCGQITNLSGPTGLAYNQSLGRLYVTNLPSSTIGIYKAPYQIPVKTLSDPGHAPYGIAICKGYVAVSN